MLPPHTPKGTAMKGPATGQRVVLVGSPLFNTGVQKLSYPPGTLGTVGVYTERGAYVTVDTPPAGTARYRPFVAWEDLEALPPEDSGSDAQGSGHGQ